MILSICAGLDSAARWGADVMTPVTSLGQPEKMTARNKRGIAGERLERFSLRRMTALLFPL
jgi:hypothetical protein